MRFGGTIIGLVVVLIGAALLIDNLEFTDTGNIPGDYWPVILIALGFFGWIGKGFRPELGTMVLMALGGILLTQNLVDDKSFVDLWPALAIAVGIAVLFGSRRKNRNKHGFGMKFRGKGKRWQNRGWCRPSGDSSSDSSTDSSAFFSGGSRRFEGEYTGGTARAKLASEGLDFSDATLPEGGAILRLDVTLGEYKIRVPQDWKIDLQAEVTMGEISDNRDSVDEPRTGPTLTIEGKIFMGGVEISG
jgi:predicted membrane protein